MGITVLDLSAYVGLVAVGAVTLNMLLGLLMAFVYPVHSPSQPLDNTIGAIALYLLAFVAVTSYVRIRLGRHLWKSFHFSIYIAAAALFWHSLFTDPALKNAPIDWSDSGKLFVESCLLVIAVISLMRLRHARRKALRTRQVAQQTVVSP